MLILILIVSSVGLIFLGLLLFRKPGAEFGDRVRQEVDRLAEILRDEFRYSREEHTNGAKLTREEVTGSFQSLSNSLATWMGENLQQQIAYLQSFSSALTDFSTRDETRLNEIYEILESRMIKSSESQREELTQVRKELVLSIHDFAKSQAEQFASLVKAFTESSEKSVARLDVFKSEVDKRLLNVLEGSQNSSARNRSELQNSLKDFRDASASQMKNFTSSQQAQLDSFGKRLSDLAESIGKKTDATRENLDQRMAKADETAKLTSAESRKELQSGLRDFGEILVNRLQEVSAKNEFKLEAMRTTVETKLGELQADNTQKLELMRATVDEKLHATLEHRLGESFKIVSERLELVHAGLGEMKTLATGVGDLRKVLTNIKTRGTWGEVQLGNLLEQTLTIEQFSKNVCTNPSSSERVEFAVKLPGREVDAPVWLPIDAKFPQEEYQRLIDAQERGDVDAAEAASSALESSVKSEAKKISEKYINPPHTTDFAILFLPTEGLFAEVLRRPGLTDNILHAFRVVISGPTTLSAVLSSLQMGFRTLAIEKRSSDVWNILGAVKTEFGKFGAALDKVQKKLHEATNTLDAAAQRSRAVERKLRSAQELPASDAATLLGVEELLGVDEDLTQSSSI